MILLDTDHVSVIAFPRGDQSARLLTKLSEAIDEQLVISVISLEEQMRAWLAEIKRRHDVAKQVAIYDRLTSLVEFYEDWEIVRFDDRAAVEFARLRKLRTKIGTQDLKIASIALVHDALLLSANLVHFQQVPGLHVEDWLH